MTFDQYSVLLQAVQNVSEYERLLFVGVGALLVVSVARLIIALLANESGPSGGDLDVR